MPTAKFAVSAFAPNHRPKRSRGLPCRSLASITSSPCGSTTATLAPYTRVAGNILALYDVDARRAQVLERPRFVVRLHVDGGRRILDYDRGKAGGMRVERSRFDAIVG